MMSKEVSDMGIPEKEIMDFIGELFKGFADPTRVHILYLLAEKERTLHEMSLGLYDGNRLINTLTVTNLPVQRNWRTNIIGNVLTSKEDFRIVIEPGFTDDYNKDIEDVEKESNK